MSKYRDFDSFWQEKQREPIKFRAFGKEFSLPPSLPAETVVKIVRLAQQSDGESGMKQAELAEISISVLGQKQLDKLFAAGADWEQLQDILRWVIEVYNGGDPNQTAPENGADR